MADTPGIAIGDSDSVEKEGKYGYEKGKKGRDDTIKIREELRA